MLQMYAYYVSNISNEIKHAYKELSDEGFEDVVTKTTFLFDNEIFDENNDELKNNQFENDDELENNQFENNEGENQISNSQNFDSFFNVTDIELRRVFEIEVTVEITVVFRPKYPPMQSTPFENFRSFLKYPDILHGKS
ncbi:hypothetical protein Glove_284g133 [Diversispora epigaea]|uniref:Uncharacterized protein n=1 Tax=Diversispora epigaea TaxID=1348612 RepID=A0A397I6E8_9GLOM|nr:hypothetical protein Glove_284g133 [Diversispora epigaea]